jgi:nucleoid-associated protein YgaU
MSLLSFMKDAGEKLFGRGTASAAPAGSAAPAPAPVDQKAQDVANGETIKKYISSLGLNASNLNVTYDSSNFTATISGEAPDQATREKIVLAAGNVMNVSQVDDNLTVAAGGQEEATFHTVTKGETLSKIAKEAYGDANQYNKIFEANRPMLKSPDLIYPGQVLRIPKK